MKVDISKIAGYADMTPEQKVAALEAFDVEPGDGYVKKAMLDKTASEAADWKRKYHDKLTEQEKKEAEEAEARQKLQNERDEYAKQVAVAKFKVEFLAQGYSEALATETAEAMHSGDMEKVLANQKAFLADYSKKAKADAMKGMKEPAGGGKADDPGKDDAAVALAKSIGQAASGSAKAANDVMSSYIINH